MSLCYLFNNTSQVASDLPSPPTVVSSSPPHGVVVQSPSPSYSGALVLSSPHKGVVNPSLIEDVCIAPPIGCNRPNDHSKRELILICY